MAIKIVANKNYAVFVENTTDTPVGPAVSVPQMGKHAHQKVARKVLEECEEDIQELWQRNPNIVRRLISDTKIELFGPR